jgi:hypothetical protein
MEWEAHVPFYWVIEGREMELAIYFFGSLATDVERLNASPFFKYHRQHQQTLCPNGTRG